jgi:regulator of sigma E protease
MQDVALTAGAPVRLGIERGDARFDLEIAPRFDANRGLYEIGIQPALRDEPLEIVDVVSGSPAQKAGLRSGDRLVAFEGERLVGSAMLERIREMLEEVGEPLSMTVVGNDGSERSIEFVPGTTKGPPRIGVLATSRQVEGVRRDAPLPERLGLRHGDLITQVDGIPFRHGGTEVIADAAADGELALEVLRGGRTVLLTASFEPSAAADLADQIALSHADSDLYVAPQDDSQAALAGMVAGDRIVAIDGREISSWADLVDAVGRAGEREIAFRVARFDGDEETLVELTIRPARAKLVDFGFGAEAQPLERVFQVDSFGGAVAEGFDASLDMIKTLYLTLKRLFTGDVGAKNLGGIITIGRVSHAYAEQGWRELLYFLALLSLNLAFVNFLPIPVLDGGHVMFLIIEKIKGSPISERLFNYSQLMGLAFVLALMVFVTYNDVVRLFSGS